MLSVLALSGLGCFLRQFRGVHGTKINQRVWRGIQVAWVRLWFSWSLLQASGNALRLLGIVAGLSGTGSSQDLAEFRNVLQHLGMALARPEDTSRSLVDHLGRRPECHLEGV